MDDILQLKQYHLQKIAQQPTAETCVINEQIHAVNFGWPRHVPIGFIRPKTSSTRPVGDTPLRAMVIFVVRDLDSSVSFVTRWSDTDFDTGFWLQYKSCNCGVVGGCPDERKNPIADLASGCPSSFLRFS